MLDRSSSTEAPQGESRRPYLIALAALACFSVVASYLVYRTIFPLDSGDLDEGVYVFQANMLLHGLVSLPVHSYGEFFRPWLTGVRDGRIFTEFQFGLPAFLAASQLIFGSMRVGLALLAGTTVIAAYGFAFELLGDRRVAVGAGAFLALSPVFLVHSALILTYTLSLFGLTAAGWGLLRGCRTGRQRDLLLGAMALGVAVLTRPFDALLFGAPLLALALHRLHRERSWSSSFTLLAVPIAIGLAPFVAATLWYNWQATGSPLAFPNMTADPLNTFGFGTRRLMIGQPARTYSMRDGLVALNANAVTIPGWLFGGPVMLILAAFGLYKMRKPAEAIALVAIAIAFPLGYCFWWATALSGASAENGLGPQYYVPSFIPLVILGAVGFTNLIENRGRTVAVAGVAVLIAVTGWAIPTKIKANLAVTRAFQHVQRLVRPAPGYTLVFIHPDTPLVAYLLAAYPFLQTNPDLHGHIVFAVDEGARDTSLIREMPHRRAYVLRRQYEPGDQLFAPSGGFFAVRPAQARRFHVSLSPLDFPFETYVRAYISDGVTSRFKWLRRGAGGDYPSTSWTVAVGSPTGSSARTFTLPRRHEGTLTVGIETSATNTFARPTWRQSRVDYATSSRTITAIIPGLGWSYVEYPAGGLWLPADVTSAIRVSVTPG